MIKTILVEDERLARNELRSMLKNFESISIIDEAENVSDAFEKIERLKPDLIFLDIQMPGDKNGFDLLEMLHHLPLVVFTTAHHEYALKAFEVNALDYLLKPIETQRLEEAIKKIEHRHKISTADVDKKLGLEDQIFVKNGERCWFVKLKDIRYFESVGNYAKVFFENQRPLILKSLNALEEKFDSTIFFRANRKQLINLKKISKIEQQSNGGFVVSLLENEKIDISRRQAVKFKDMMSL
jgi:two-component system LytT family response regulator